MAEYSLIESDRHDELVEAVCRAEAEGWTCQGGICMAWDPHMPNKHPERGFLQRAGGFVYAQALIRNLPFLSKEG